MNQIIKKQTGIIVTLIGGTMWGFSGTCGQYLFRSYGVDATWLTAVRMICAGIILCILGLIKDKGNMLDIWKSKWGRIQLLLFAIAGLMFCQLAYMKAIAYSNSGTATILQYLGPVFILIISCVTSRRMPKKNETIAIVMALCGTFILATHGNIRSMAITPAGLLWGLLAAVGLTLYTMLPKRIINQWGSVTVTGYGMLIGGIVLGLFKHVWSIRVVLDLKSGTALAAVVLLGTVLAFTMYLYGVKSIGAVKASMLACVEPVSATFFMVLWLHERFQWIDAVGSLCILTTVFLLSKKEKQVDNAGT